MDVVINICCVVVLAVIAIGVYDLQSWLERSDRERHLED